MPLVRNHKKELRLTLPGSSTWNSPLNVDNQNKHPSLLNNGCQYDVRLNDREARAVRGENTECFDELDLVSECSSPCSYTPGKYLQLCDIEPSDGMDDVTLFPVSLQSSDLSDLEEVSLLTPQRGPSLAGSSFKKIFQDSNSARVFPFVSNKTLLIVAVCMVVALTALGCLVTVI